jgi:hypothetical protein
MDKSNKKYATIGKDFDGMDFRGMAQAMTTSGLKMNHATARNVLLSAMHKFAKQYNKQFGHNLTKDQVKSLAADANFQSGVGSLVQDIYCQRKANIIETPTKPANTKK